MIQLPEPIQAYIEAHNAQDIEGIVACFAQDAEVKSEQKTYRGTEEITEWVEETVTKYHSQITPTKLANSDPDVLITAELTSDSESGSTELQFTFSLEDDKIANLEIH